MNEEDVKNKLVVPWLQKVGIRTEDLYFESHFIVRLGRQVYQVGSDQLSKKATGFSDILVKQGGRNLLVIETKSSSKRLNDDDRDQAISYARLLDQIAPYAVVTNGTEWNLYDVVTKEKIEASAVSFYGRDIKLSDENIADAQMIFLRLDSNNLHQFCGNQIEGQLQYLKGTISENKKYVPELHVKRKNIWEKIYRFLESSQPAMILTGKSGWGKSCEVSAIVEDLLCNGKPVFFFNGIQIGNGLLEAIAAEFEWEFEEGVTPIGVIKRIDRISGNLGCVIVVDAIDEWSFNDRSGQLSKLIKAIKNKNIKLILSCKDTVIESFLKTRGTSTETGNSAQIVEIPLFTDAEFRDAISRYRKIYEIDSSFEKDVYERAKRDPFLLRILFDVAKERGTSEFRFDSRTLFERYLNQFVNKTINPELATRTLKKVAEYVYEENVTSISEEVIRSKLGLSINESIMEELFDFGLLIRSDMQDGDYEIEFYFQQLRDFVIAFWVLKLDKVTDAKLKSTFANVSYPSVQGDSLSLFYRLTTRDQKIVIDGSLRESATIYLDTYVRAIAGNFPILAIPLNSIELNRIGFVSELLMPDVRVGFYGFQEVEVADDRIEFIPTSRLSTDTNRLSDNWNSRLVTNAEIQIGDCIFREKRGVRKYAIEKTLLPKLYSLIEEGGLNASNTPDILKENILGTVLENKDIFKSLFDDYSDDRLPRYISVTDVETCVLRRKLYKYFDSKLLEKLIDENVIHVSSDGTYASYSHSYRASDFAWIKDKVNSAIESGEIPAYIHLDVDFKKISNLVSQSIAQLEACGISQIDTTFLGSSIESFFDGKIDDIKVLGAFICDLNDRYYKNYNLILDTNFPSLKTLVPIKNEDRCTTFLIILDQEMDRMVRRRNDQNIILHTVESANLQKKTVLVSESEVVVSEDRKYLMVGPNKYKLVTTAWTSVRSFFSKDIGLQGASLRYMPLRAYAHSRILKELSEIDESEIVERLLSDNLSADDDVLK